MAVTEEFSATEISTQFLQLVVAVTKKSLVTERTAIIDADCPNEPISYLRGLLFVQYELLYLVK